MNLLYPLFYLGLLFSVSSLNSTTSFSLDKDVRSSIFTYAQMRPLPEGFPVLENPFYNRSNPLTLPEGFLEKSIHYPKKEILSFEYLLSQDRFSVVVDPDLLFDLGLIYHVIDQMTEPHIQLGGAILRKPLEQVGQRGEALAREGQLTPFHVDELVKETLKTLDILVQENQSRRRKNTPHLFPSSLREAPKPSSEADKPFLQALRSRFLPKDWRARSLMKSALALLKNQFAPEQWKPFIPLDEYFPHGCEFGKAWTDSIKRIIQFGLFNERIQNRAPKYGKIMIEA